MTDINLYLEKKISCKITYILLFSRMTLFIFFQALISIILHSWEISEKYWLLSATLTNIVSITLLLIIFKRDGISFLKIFSPNKKTIKKDIYIFIGIVFVTMPIVFVPGYFLSILIWGDPNVPNEMMFRPVEKWLVYILLVAFPVTIIFSELATYFSYIMPKLKEQINSKWLVVFLPVLFLSIQHCTLPFIPDLNFIIYRALVFLPFATLIGVSINYRPSLFIYFAILHGILDFGAALMFLF